MRLDGIAALEALERAEAEAQPSPADSSPAGRAGAYEIRDGRIVRVRLTRDGPVEDILAHFVARIAEEVVEDDGAERTRRWRIEGATPDGRALPAAIVAAAEFPSMAWVTREWGSRAIVSAGATAKDALREAIQRLSGDVPERYVYTHTGWRRLDARWVFLHAAGAIGAEGVEVKLPRKLQEYVLPSPPTDPDTARQAVGAATDAIVAMYGAARAAGWVLLAALARAPLSSIIPSTVIPWFYGPTGGLKTSTVTAGLALFGCYTEHNPPESWLSTENAIESALWTLADLPLLIDDYAPSHARQDGERMRQAAQGLLRRVGNHVGRGRLRADLSRAPDRPPRALAIVTAEELPGGRLSGLARVFPVPLERGQVDVGRLTEVQAAPNTLGLAGAAYIDWLRRLRDGAPDLAEDLRCRQEDLRRRAVTDGHPRVADNVAVLALGLDTWLAMAVDIGALSEVQAAEALAEGWAALIGLAREHTQLLEEEAPEVVLLQAIGELIASGRLDLVPLGQGRGAAHGTLVGWYDSTHVYLLPDTAYEHAERVLARGRGLAASPQAIWRALERRGALVRGEGDRLASRLPTTLPDGTRPRVIRLSRARLQALGASLVWETGTFGTSGPETPS